MIKTALVFIKQQLDQYLKNRFELEESVTVLNHLVGQDGLAPLKNQNKMVITLINLDHETAKQFYGSVPRSQQDTSLKTQPAVHFNVDLLFSASFDDYEEALKFLNATVCYFQANNSLNSQVTADMPQNITRLDFEIENSSYLEMHNLWSAMGAKYMPSMIYKVRHLTIDAEQIESEVTHIAQSNSAVSQ